MSEMKKQIRSDMTTAMKERDKIKTGALRMLLAAIQTEETAGTKHEVTDADVLKVIAREIKKRKESADVYASNNRPELAQQELAEAEVLAFYQPKQLSDEEIATLVSGIIAQVREDQGEVTMKHMGQIMQQVTTKAAGAADGKRLSAAVRAALS